MPWVCNEEILHAKDRWYSITGSQLFNFFMPLGVFSYWHLTDDEELLVRQLNGPYWQAVIKAKLARANDTKDVR